MIELIVLYVHSQDFQSRTTLFDVGIFKKDGAICQYYVLNCFLHNVAFVIYGI